MNLLAGKRVVITGAAGALGRVVAAIARGHGASIIGLDVAFAEGDHEASADDQRHRVDLADAAATRLCFERLGAFDALFNLAGGFAMASVVGSGADDAWDSMFTRNVDTLRNALHAAVPAMLATGGGAIVNVGALGAARGGAGMAAYAAAKSAVARLTESLSDEVRDHGIRVNAVLPSVLDTPRNRMDMPDADPGRWVAPADLAEVICFLGSPHARAMHGALVAVRGLA